MIYNLRLKFAFATANYLYSNHPTDILTDNIEFNILPHCQSQTYGSLYAHTYKEMIATGKYHRSDYIPSD